MKKLVAEGADINEGNSRGWTALMYACRYRHAEVGLCTQMMTVLWFSGSF